MLKNALTVVYVIVDVQWVVILEIIIKWINVLIVEYVLIYVLLKLILKTRGENNE